MKLVSLSAAARPIAVVAGASLGACFMLTLHSAAAPTAVPACTTDLEGQLETLDVPGLSAAIVKHGKIVCASAAGMADVQENRPVTPDTLFLVASISKTITATAVMQLVEQGRLELDDDVDDYLPFKLSIPFSPKAPVTLRQLLTHTASIDDNPAYINCPGWCTYGSSISPFVTRGADAPVSLSDFTKGYFTPDGPYYDWSANFEDAEPGTKTDYSNMGIVVAGYLVEAVAGISFDQYTRENIFAPLGMDKTSWRLAEIDPSILAMPYDKDSSGFVPYGHYGEPDYPDGMLRTSATELAHFLIANMDGGAFGDQQILEPETVDEILSSQTKLEPDQGLVWVKNYLGDRAVWGHDGADNGASANMWFDPEKDEGVILMTNGVWNDDEELLNLLFQEADDY
jgi:CubicO group peptidase (beta-lactamase class C family)